MSASVLVLSAEPVGERMAGPAIRAAELARQLARENDVTLAAPAPSRAPAGMRLLEAGFEDLEALLGAARRHEVVVAQELPPTLLGRLARLPARVVLDLYNPIVVEVLEAVAARSERAQGRIRSLIAARALAQLAVADFVICASERQRDLWLGGLALAGLVEPELYRRDPSLRALIDVVPFGIPSEPPSGGGALRAAFPAIGDDERVLLWGGGVWGWLDPDTPIRATALLERTHLVFMGTGRPGLAATGQAPFAERAVELARRVGLEAERVHFNPDWVPYAERAGWLLDADVGVSAHRDHLEARFSHRTRVLDYLWAGLPVVATEGDALADLVQREGLGATVPPEDPEAFAAACRALLDEGAGAEAKARIEALRPALSWDAAARPLLDWCARRDELPRRRPPRGALRRALGMQYARTLALTLNERGPRAAAAQVLRRLRRAARER